MCMSSTITNGFHVPFISFPKVYSSGTVTLHTTSFEAVKKFAVLLLIQSDLPGSNRRPQDMMFPITVLRYFQLS